MWSFSFSVPKIITMWQWWAIITNDEKLDLLLRKIKDFWRIKWGVDFHDMLWWNFKVTDIQSVIWIEQLKDVNNRVKRKKEIYNKFKDRFKDIKSIDVPTCNEEVSPWFFEILVKEKKEELMLYLKENWIWTREFYPPINHQPFYNDWNIYPISEKFSKEWLWLPSSSNLSDEDINLIIEKITGFYN
jgi:perosamine synthetase